MYVSIIPSSQEPTITEPLISLKEIGDETLVPGEVIVAIDKTSASANASTSASAKTLDTVGMRDPNTNGVPDGSSNHPAARSLVVPCYGDTDSRYRGTGDRLAELEAALAKLGVDSSRQTRAKRDTLYYKISILKK